MVVLRSVTRKVSFKSGEFVHPEVLGSCDMASEENLKMRRPGTASMACFLLLWWYLVGEGIVEFVVIITSPSLLSNKYGT